MAPTPRPSQFRRLAPQHLTAPLCVVALLSALLLLNGCGSFFTCEGKTSCPTTCVASSTVTCPATGGTGSTTVDYAYVSNSSTSNTDIDGYNLGAGTLTNATSAPFSFGYVPSSMVVTPANTFLYAATDAVEDSGHGYVYGYSIGSGGALSIISSGDSLIPGEDITSLAISPNGEWLFCLDTDGITLEEYSINTSTGALTFAQTYGITGASGATVLPAQVTIAPSGDFLVVALGQGGAETFSLNQSTGAAAAVTLLSPSTTAIGINAAAIDANNNLYLAGTNGLSVYSTTTAGVPTLLNSYTTGNGAHSVVVASTTADSVTTPKYVYVGNESDGTISAFSIGTNAALTPVSGSPFTAPPTVDALALDSTNAYLIASGYSATTGIQLFTIGSTGALTSAGTAGTGTSGVIPGAIATTH